MTNELLLAAIYFLSTVDILFLLILGVMAIMLKYGKQPASNLLRIDFNNTVWLVVVVSVCLIAVSVTFLVHQ